MTEVAPTTKPLPEVAPTTKPLPVLNSPAPVVPEPDPDVTLDVALRNRLIAVLRPRLTTTVAGMYVDRILPEVKAYGEEMIAAALAVQGDVIGELIGAAQDCLDVLSEGDGPACSP